MTSITTNGVTTEVFGPWTISYDPADAAVSAHLHYTGGPVQLAQARGPLMAGLDAACRRLWQLADEGGLRPHPEHWVCAGGADHWWPR